MNSIQLSYLNLIGTRQFSLISAIWIRRVGLLLEENTKYDFLATQKVDILHHPSLTLNHTTLL